MKLLKPADLPIDTAYFWGSDYFLEPYDITYMQADITHHLKNSQAFLLILIHFSICWLTTVLGMEEEEIIHDIRTKMWKVNGFDMTAIAYKTWSNSNHSYN